MRLHMFDLFAAADFNTAVAAKLITVREDGAGLRILNYSDSALYTEGAWSSPAVRTCRGLIVDTDGYVVARPWAKFFNHGQPEAGDLDLMAAVEVTDKLDGSLGIVHLTASGEPRVATRGSFESHQAIHATAVLQARYVEHLGNLNRVTPLVEVIYPGNRIVVDYGDRDDLVLLGGVVIESGDYLGPAVTAASVGWSGPLTEVFEYPTLRDALAADPRPGMEGLVVRRLDVNHLVKIKQDDYVALHRIVTGLSERTVWQHMSADQPLDDMLVGLPDELHDWTRDVWARLSSAVAETEDEARRAHQEVLASLPDGWERREYAEQAKARAPLTPLLFQILDGKNPRSSILRNLRPAGDTRAKAISEAVA